MQSPTPKTPSNDKQIQRNRLKLLAIFAVALAPVIIAMVMYQAGWAIPDGRTNKGNLMWPPVELNMLDLGSVSAAKNWQDSSDKWVLMMTGGRQCDQTCRELIHEVRQVNVAMGRENDRVKRLLVSELPENETAVLSEQYPRLGVLGVDTEQRQAFYIQAQERGAEFAADNDDWMVWIVDPLGNVILQYTPEHDGYDLMGDLKRLLKLSKIG